MSHLSPPYGPAETTRVENTISTPRAHPAMGSTNPSISGLAWHNGQPVLRMQDAVVETIVTHTTRTTTSFAPIPLPRLPEPDHIPLPAHLSPQKYPLALEPVPEDMKFFAMNISGQRVVVQEDGSMGGLASPLPAEIGGPGWKRSMQTSGLRDNMPRMNLAGALGGGQARDVRKRPLSTSLPAGMGPSAAPTPPVTGDGKTRARSPPRKRVRGLDEIIFPHQEGALLSPLPSPGEDAPAEDPMEPRPIPHIGTGAEFAALVSLPALINHFDTLPDKLQQHIMMQFLRRSRTSTIQRVTSFASKALRRDFITQLPHEVAVHILKSVDTKTLARATRVNHKWRRLIDSERSVWRQRMVDDDLWQGVGTEEEEENMIKQRMDTLRWKARLKAMESETDLDDEELLEMVSAGLGPDADTASSHDTPFPIPLKHVYRRRYMSERNWLGRAPIHRSFPGQGTNVITCTQFDRDKIITAADDNAINVYDIRQGTLRKRLDGHDGGVWALEYRGDTLVTGSTDRTVRIWDLETFTEAHCFLGHKSTVRCLQIVEPVLDKITGEYSPPYPLIVTGSRDSNLRVWRLPNKGELRANEYTIEGEEIPLIPAKNPFHLFHLKGHTQAVRALAAYGRLCMSGSYDCTVRVWDIVKGTCLQVLTGHEAKVYSVVYDRHRNRCSSGSMDNTVRVWDVGTGECLHVLQGHTALVGLLALSPNYLVSAAADASLRVWDTNTQSLQNIFDSHGGAITCFAHDETKVVSGSDGCLKLWDIKTGQFVRDLVSGIQSVWQVVFKDNMLVAATSRGGGTVFEIFKFGDINDPSGVDDESLDKFRRPEWETRRLRQVQRFHDGPTPYKHSMGRGNERARLESANGQTSRAGKARRSARIATKSTYSTEAQASGSPRWRGPTPAQWDTLQPLESPSRRYDTRASTSHSHPAAASIPRTVLRSAVAGPSQTRSSARRTSEMARRSDSPTPIGTSSGIDMLRATSPSGYREQEEVGDEDEEGEFGGEEDEVDWEVEGGHGQPAADEYAGGAYYNAREEDEGEQEDEGLDEGGDEGVEEDWEGEAD